MAEQPKPQPIHILVTPKYDSSRSRITFVNYSRISHVGTDLILDLGNLDDHVLLQRLPQNLAGRIEIPAYVIDRYGMSIDVFKQLRENIEEMWSKLKATGVIKEDEDR